MNLKEKQQKWVAGVKHYTTSKQMELLRKELLTGSILEDKEYYDEHEDQLEKKVITTIHQYRSYFKSFIKEAYLDSSFMEWLLATLEDLYVENKTIDKIKPYKKESVREGQKNELLTSLKQTLEELPIKTLKRYYEVIRDYKRKPYQTNPLEQIEEIVEDYSKCSLGQIKMMQLLLENTKEENLSGTKEE